jgi:hypothetical protein
MTEGVTDHAAAAGAMRPGERMALASFLMLEEHSGGRVDA